MKESAEEILRLTYARDARCALSLRVSSLEQLGPSLVPAQCFLTTMIGDSSRCKTCPSPAMCECLRDHFQSTTNSKRRVSTYLFWKNKLGLNFPVSDDMLERQVWKNLDSCENGIKRGNGQRKVRNGPVCVNPYCYKPANAYAILAPLASTLTILGLTNDGVIAKTLEHMGWSGTDFNPPATADETFGSKGLELIAVRVRQIAEESVAAAQAASAAAAAGVRPSGGAAAAAAAAQQMAASSTLTPGSSPAYSNGGASPAYVGGNGSQHSSGYASGYESAASYGNASPAHSSGSSPAYGGASPEYGGASPPFGGSSPAYGNGAAAGAGAAGTGAMTPSPSPTYVTDEFVFDPAAMPASLVPVPAGGGGSRGISPERTVPDAHAQGAIEPLEIDLNFESVWASTVGAQAPHAKHAAQTLSETKTILSALQHQQYTAAQQYEIGALESALNLGGAGVGGGAAPQHAAPVHTESDDLASLLALDIDSLAAPWGSLTSNVTPGQGGAMHAVSGFQLNMGAAAPHVAITSPTSAVEFGAITTAPFVLVESGGVGDADAAAAAASTSAASAAAAAATGMDGSGATVDAACKVGNVVGAFPAGEGSKSTTISRITAGNVGKAMHIGVLSSRNGEATDSMLCMMGVTKVKVCGPVRANDTVYADLSPGKEGCGTTTAPSAAAAGGGGVGGGGADAAAAASPCIVIGRVVTAGTLLRDAGADVESDVLCVISTGGADEQMAKVTTAKLRVELNKKIADHVKDGSSNVTVGGLTNSMTTLVVGKNSATNKQQTIAAAGADSIAFQKVDGLEDGTVTVLCSHSSTKMLQVAGEGNVNVNVNVNASGTLSPSAMFVVVSSVEGDGDGGGPQGVRLQHAEDDACWLRVGKDGAVDAEGDPDAEETLFVVTTHADGSLSLKSVAAGKVLAVGKDGVVAAAEGADDVAGSTKFTAYQRLLAA